MINNELKKPLLQSLAVIVVGIIFFSFVATSGAHDLFGSIWAIISGIFFTAMYIIGLGLGVAVCIACLIGIFLIAVYMVDKLQSSVMFNHVKRYVFCSMKCSSKNLQ